MAFGVAALGLLLGTSVADAGIKGSKHDLGASGTSQHGTTGNTNTTEVCVFCHTPHGANTGAAAPLWNKSLPAAGSYTRYSSLNSSTIDGAELAVGSVSLACLSCHDGSQAMDVMINKPGSGGYTAGGAAFQANAAMTGTPLPNLGVDISNDHPISIQYGGGGWVGGDTDGTAAAGDLADGSFKAGVKDTINTNPVWWIDTGNAGVRDKTDIILYTRTNGATKEPFVECASCHDPHNATAQPVSFMRISNAASAVCLACHDK
ncbi:MAG: hypothetical protein G8237_06340 [Magnetococcales bacterium]|nr:hypothetical protein [Magnetococcales bacterium]